MTVYIETLLSTSFQNNEFLLCTCVLVSRSCLNLCNHVDCSPPGSSLSMWFSSQNTGVGSHSLLQGIFPTQGSNLHLLRYRQILYCLSHQGSPSSLASILWRWPVRGLFCFSLFLRSILNYLCLCVCVYTFRVFQLIIISLFDAHCSIFGQ